MKEDFRSTDIDGSTGGICPAQELTKSWYVRFHKQALKDVELCKRAGLGDKVKSLVDVLKSNPWENPPPYEKLIGDLNGMYSRRINRQHRMVYTVNVDMHTVSILALWTHYEHK